MDNNAKLGIMQSSALGRVWQEKGCNLDEANYISNKYNLSNILSILLSQRNIHPSEIENFLSPKIKNYFPDPFHLLDMNKAVKRVIEAIIEKEKIFIFADYDVDGATSSALLKTVLSYFGISTTVYIPDRFKDGYGPNKKIMQKIKDNGGSLVFTLDCGTSSHDVMTFAKNIDLDVIIIDHHISINTAKDAYAIINPNRFDDNSSYGNLAAVGVTFFFIVALCSRLRDSKFYKASEINLLQYIDLVALGTVCDVVSLTGINRAFVKQGLKIIAQKQNQGIGALCDVSDIKQNITCYHLGYILGPKINAGGRIGESYLGSELLSSTCRTKALTIAKQLNLYNEKRKEIEQEIYEKAIIQAEKQKSDPILFIVGENWHVGVIGIVTGRLKEIYNKPVIVTTIKNDIGKASCRSVIDIDIGRLLILAQEKELLISGGGHAMAGGFTIKKEKLSQFHIFIIDNIAKDKNIKKYQLDLKISEYDLVLDHKDLTIKAANEIHRISPFGTDNKEPIFRINNLFLKKSQNVGAKHIKCVLLYNNQKYIEAIAYNAQTNQLNKILNKTDSIISLIGNIKVNSFFHNTKLQLVIRDIL